MIDSPPASAVCTSILIDATSIPVSAVTSSVSAIDTNSSVELPTSVVDSTSVLSTPSSDVNPTSVGESRTMVNPISGLLTSLTEQQQQYIARATDELCLSQVMSLSGALYPIMVILTVF